MPEQFKADHDASHVDAASSRACTQAGAFALLLSLALLVLIPNWVEYPREIALSKYITYRLNFANEVRELDSDPTFQKFMSSEKTDQSLARLLTILEPTPTTAQQHQTSQLPPPTQSKIKLEDKKNSSRNDSKAKPELRRWVPRMPENLVVVVPPRWPEVQEIADSLENLNDPQLLISTMKESNSFADSVAAWGNKRNELLYHNQVNYSCFNAPLEVPNIRSKDPDYTVPLLDTNGMLECLTVNDVRTLAMYELPKYSDPPTVADHIQKSVDIRPGALPTSLYAASIALQILLAFVVTYFGAFAREATGSLTFPTSGTLFGAFSKSDGTLFVFLLAIWTPALASISMSIVSWKWLTLTGDIPVVASVIFVHMTLQHHSYFMPLMRHWRRFTRRMAQSS